MALVLPSVWPRRGAAALPLLFAALAVLGYPGWSSAQEVYDGFATDDPMYFCEPQCGSECAPQCAPQGHGGIWFGAEYLRWRIEGADELPPLVTDAPASTPLTDFPGALDNADTRILYGNQTVGEDWRDGYRLYGGIWLDCCQCCGIGADYFDTENDNFFMSDANSGRIVARPFFDTQAGEDRSELVDVPNQLDGSVVVATSDDFSGAGIAAQSRLWQCCDPCGCGPTSRVYLLGGYRYYQYDTDLALSENLLFLPGSTFPGVIPGTTIFLEDRFSTENEFHGGEAGFQGMVQQSWWWVDGLFKVAIGSHRRTVTINGQTINTVPGGGTTEFAGGLLTSDVTNIGRYADNSIAVIPELRVGVGSQLTCNVSVRAGYGIIFWNSVARAGSQLPPGLEVDPRNQPPIDPNNPGGPEPEFNGIFGDRLVAHGFDFGVQFTY